MDRSSYKHYHLDPIDTRKFFHTYFSGKSDKIIIDEIVKYPMEILHKEFKSGNIKGDTFIDISIGSAIFHLLPVCDHFKEITILESNDQCLEDIVKWMKKDADALDWSHASTHMAKLEEEKSGKWEEKEELLRSRVKRILKCDFTKEILTDPVVLDKADCLMSMCIMHFVHKDHDSYRAGMKKVASLIKLGGHLVMIGGFNTRYCTVGEDKLHMLSFDENFMLSNLKSIGFSIESFQKTMSKLSGGMIDYDHIWFVRAVKMWEL
ncbi:nicotinamide N-methyltransferase-like [Pelobates cultripes]|uniref:Nicotinamide N-methyltransferase-like n=1 Tax=Pelobates cultripes TaxID=61616 RepID=A0AAD1WMK3_PELCU|nr:nicotinamide N-methyltransferase-like [Pelobates cultripes]